MNEWVTHTDSDFSQPDHIYQCEKCEFKSNTWVEKEDLTETVWCEDSKEWIEVCQLCCPKCKSWFYF
jgi:preprotein translocase subunit SecA